MATTVERLGIVETKVENLNEKVDDIKVDIKDMHDCLDNTRDTVLAQLNSMTTEYRSNAAAYYQHADKLNQQQSDQHAELAGKIGELEKWKQKWLYMIAGGAIVVSWISSHLDLVIALLK
jgi:chromosome segregation ATPase